MLLHYIGVHIKGLIFKYLSNILNRMILLGKVYKGIIKITLLIVIVGISVRCSKKEEYTGYVFAYFTGNGPGQEQIHYAVSNDGFNYKALNNNKPIIKSEDISTSGGVRDPHILRSSDGKSFYMVVTDLYVPKMGWQNQAMVLMKSDDLVNWESSVVNMPKEFPKEFGQVNRVWAPQTIYDKATDKYMVYFSMRTNGDPDIIYYAYANEDFTGFESAPKQLFFSPTNNACIDADIIEKDNQYYMFFKSEDGKPGIKLAVSDKINEGYKQLSPDRVDKEVHNVEGSGVFKLNNSDEWILMYDVYMRGHYQFTKSKDLMNFEVIDDEISMNFHPRHGSVLPITETEMKRLIEKWGSFEDLMIEATSNQLKLNNVIIDGENKKIQLPVKRGTDLSSFDPMFVAHTGFAVSPLGAQDFSKGPLTYEITIEGKGTQNFEVSAVENNNPVIEGYYADPDLIYAEKTGKYYMYPTSDGFDNWGGYYFKTFSSTNLVDWNEEGIILDLKKDVSWADRNAWAPCIIEQKVNEAYKYFYYFTAAQKIGVAVADNPEGPFVDSGKALIDKRPKGINRGQVIDPDVFKDPKSGKCYLYWGNGFMAAAELNADMVSLKESTFKLMNPDKTYREGTHVFYRKGKYYFLWSEDDTRSPNYRVRYAIANSPLGKLTIPENNIVIEKKPELGIFGTGHNTTIQIPGKDDWYIVYHRFTLPKGIEMGRAAGYHREVCIDKMQFDEDGYIIPVVPTLEGIASLN